MTADFSPELRLVLALLRTALGAASPAPVEAVDWKNFLGLVQRHRAGAFLYHRAAGSLAAICPPPVVMQLRAIAEKSTERALAQTAELVRLVHILASAGVDSMPVKGVVLSQQLYGAIGLRHVGDIDLLVRPADVVAADAVLQSAGLRRTRPDFPLTSRQTVEYLRLKPEFEYQRESPPHQRTEVLWRLEGLPATEAVWATAVPCVLAGRAVRTLSPEPNALYLFQHGARHGWFRLFWLLDVALLLRDRGFDWETTSRRARALGLERCLLQGAALVRDLFGIDPPAALQPRRTEQRVVVSLAAESRRQLLGAPTTDQPVGEWCRQLLYRVRLQRGLRAKFAVLTPHLFSPLNWQTLPLPDRWFFLYYFATPFLWIWRRVRRAAG